MISLRIFTIISILWSFSLSAQSISPNEARGRDASIPAQPFLFLANTINPGQANKAVNYSGSMGQRAEGPFGYDGFNQQGSLSAYLGRRFTFIGSVALGFSNHGGTQTAQQAELIKNFIGGKKAYGAAIGLGLGFSRDWDNVKSALSRITMAYNNPSLRLSGNMLFEKAFSTSRDKLDFTSSLGFQHRIKGSVFAGVEMIGEDLEGFWEEDEAEGGAKMLIGPSINFSPSKSRFSFSACGGPVFFATKSTAFSSGALREIGRSSQNGYSVRAGLGFNLR
jgi:hypothetical protein